MSIFLKKKKKMLNHSPNIYRPPLTSTGIYWVPWSPEAFINFLCTHLQHLLTCAAPPHPIFIYLLWPHIYRPTLLFPTRHLSTSVFPSHPTFIDLHCPSPPNIYWLLLLLLTQYLSTSIHCCRWFLKFSITWKFQVAFLSTNPMPMKF